MNYQQPEMLEQLAAAYVLGTLRGRARLRFEKLCEQYAPARSVRHRWEDRLLPLAMSLTPVAPRDVILPAIRRQLVSRPPSRWLSFAAAASLVAITLLIGRLAMWTEPVWRPMATLAEANAAPLWRIERSPDSTRLIMHTVGTVNLATTQSYELWVLPAGGGNPVSLGLMPTKGDAERTLTAQQRELLLTAMNVAISLEPAGGSPTGLPTGPVVIVAPIAALG
jgi:anti-sigma-K factor RskA